MTYYLLLCIVAAIGVVALQQRSRRHGPDPDWVDTQARIGSWQRSADVHGLRGLEYGEPLPSEAAPPLLFRALRADEDPQPGEVVAYINTFMEALPKGVAIGTVTRVTSSGRYNVDIGFRRPVYTEAVELLRVVRVVNGIPIDVLDPDEV